MSTLQIARPHRCGQAIGGVVGNRESLRLVIEPDECYYGPEDFFARHAARVTHLAEYGGLNEVSGTLEPPATRQNLHAFGSRDVEVSHDLVELHLRGHWAELRLWIERIARDQLTCLGHHAIGYRVVHTRFHQHP